MIAIDRAVPTELWRLDADAVSPTLWNDDWDGFGLIADGHLFEGGENSQFHAVRLNRSRVSGLTVPKWQGIRLLTALSLDPPI